MKLIKLPILFFIISVAFAISANAQTECSYSFRMIVRDTRDKPVDKTSVEVVRGAKPKETIHKAVKNANNVHEAAFTAPCAPKESPLKVTMAVSGEGFATHNREIVYDEMTKLHVVTLMTQAESDAATGWLEGSALDDHGAVISYVIVAATAADGKRYYAQPNADMKYVHRLPKGIYRIEAVANGFENKVFQNYKIVDSTFSKMSLDFVMSIPTMIVK